MFINDVQILERRGSDAVLNFHTKKMVVTQVAHDVKELKNSSTRSA